MTKNHAGVYIAVEGGDGSGKRTQVAELVRTLKEQGYDVFATSYPQYGKPSARYVERYLRGEYGSVNDVHPDLAALTYAIDRVDNETLVRVREHLSKPLGIVISDRSPASNMAHQGTKFPKLADRQRFYREIVELEYDVLREPRPDLNLVLKVPAYTAQQNVDKKATSVHNYTTAKRDIHEADANHLTLALRGYNELCELLPDEFVPVEALDIDNRMRPIAEVHEEIMELIRRRDLLPDRS